MELGNVLIESNKKTQKKGSWKTMATSLLLHTAAIGSLLVISMTAVDKAEADEKAIPVYMSESAAPPPPPPPPPPAPAASSTPVQPKVDPHVVPVEVPQETFVQPTEIPDIVPVVDPIPVPSTGPAEPASGGLPSGGVEGGVEGGVVGGVVGGVEGGTVGGQIGGQIGGEIGGVPGGVVGGVVGGTPGGTGTAPVGPLRVGGDVKAPRISNKVDPEYTEVARRARVQGIVILEAIIDKQGNVDNVKVIRGLPMGLSESAVQAVKRWKFRPGTMNGRPVDVIFNLTVNFRLGADGPSVTKTARPAPQRVEPAPQRVEPEPQPTAPEPESLPEVPQPSEPEAPAPEESLPTPPSD